MRTKSHKKNSMYIALIVSILIVSIFSVQAFSNNLEIKVNVSPKKVQQGHHINIEIWLIGITNGTAKINASIMYGNRTITRLFNRDVFVNNGTFHAVIKITVGYDWPLGNYTVIVSYNNMNVNASFMVLKAMPFSYIDKHVVERTIYFLKMITINIDNKTIQMELNKTIEFYIKGEYRKAYLTALNVTALTKKYISKSLVFSKQTNLNATIQRYQDLIKEVNMSLISLKKQGFCNETLLKNLSQIREMIQNISKLNLSKKELFIHIKSIEKVVNKIINNTVMRYSSKVEQLKILRLINKLKQKINDSECIEMLNHIEKNVKNGNYTSYHHVFKKIKAVHMKYMSKMKKMIHMKSQQNMHKKQMQEHQSMQTEHQSKNTGQESQTSGSQGEKGKEGFGMSSGGQEKDKGKSNKH